MMTDVNPAYEHFKQWASLLKTEDGISYSAKGPEVIDQMANGYCAALDSADEKSKNKYISGLMLRFWAEIGKSMAKSPNLSLEFDDFMSWLYEAIEYACKYRAWLDPNKPNVKNAQQAIRQCIETIRLQHYYEFNLDKNRANYHITSMDAPLEDDNQTTLADTLVDEDEQYRSVCSESEAAARAMIQKLVSRKKLVEAIILDTIAFNDVQKVTKKVVKSIDTEGNPQRYTEVYKEFWPFKCVQLLNKLPDSYAEYFGATYSINPIEFGKALEAIRSANNQKLYRYLRNTLEGAKTVFTY